jgi:hypothetical protein
MIIKKIVPALTAATLLLPTLTGGIIATTIAIVPNIIAPQPAVAAWWDNADGVYINAYGSQYYYGTYVSNPNPKFEGSTWEITCGGNVCAHGYSRSIPRVVQWLAQRLGG